MSDQQSATSEYITVDDFFAPLYIYTPLFTVGR
jgi:hypothetical protein